MTTRAFKADCLYGATGLRKTTNIGLCAQRWYKRTSKDGKPLKTRLVSADPGGWETIQSLIDAGIIEAWAVNQWPNRIEAIDLACQGYWPADPMDPKSPLVNPRAGNGLASVGLYAFEGLTSFGSHIMGALKKPGVSLSQEPSYVLRDGGQSYAGGSMAAFGFVQDRIYDFVAKSHMIPCVEKVIWTALEAKGEEEGTKIPIFGPAIEGRKSIGKAGQWFGNLIHLETAVVEVTQDKESKQLSLKTEVWAYLRSHADPNSKIVFPAKVRAPFEFAHKVPERMEPDLAKIYDLLDQLKTQADERVAKLKPSQPAATGGKVAHVS
jgi:hypothetical protein